MGYIIAINYECCSILENPLYFFIGYVLYIKLLQFIVNGQYLNRTFVSLSGCNKHFTMCFSLIHSHKHTRIALLIIYALYIHQRPTLPTDPRPLSRLYESVSQRVLRKERFIIFMFLLNKHSINTLN